MIHDWMSCSEIANLVNDYASEDIINPCGSLAPCPEKMKWAAWHDASAKISLEKEKKEIYRDLHFRCQLLSALL
ncbi:hypothetical protein CEXT_751131 [Caerostris extrusa]|uniref:Uncharacterized protein n=1 Tax=Caerostris extrusa TaxID=172846 RepID=A0AAV4MHE5_CAEEX|nr:hypothetical protein CEXT_751131 [Caerostris extrusa]